jgi:hypothetical protein
MGHDYCPKCNGEAYFKGHHSDRSDPDNYTCHSCEKGVHPDYACPKCNDRIGVGEDMEKIVKIVKF